MQDADQFFKFQEVTQTLSIRIWSNNICICFGIDLYRTVADGICYHVKKFKNGV